MNANPYAALAQVLMMFQMCQAMSMGQSQFGPGMNCGMPFGMPFGNQGQFNFDPCCMPMGTMPDMSCWGNGFADPCQGAFAGAFADPCMAGGSFANGFTGAGNNLNIALAISLNQGQGEACPAPAQSSAAAAAAVSTQPAPEAAAAAAVSSGGDGGGGSGGDGGGGGGGGTPVILDLNGDGKLDTTGKGGKKVNFDLNGDGKADRTEWMKKGSQDGMLVADYNGDGKINDGREMMRNTGEDGTAFKYKNGWEKLSALHDKNKDGQISGDELKDLKMWVDSNGDAKTDPGELKSLASLGISQINIPKNGVDSNFVRNGKSQYATDYNFQVDGVKGAI